MQITTNFSSSLFYNSSSTDTSKKGSTSANSSGSSLDDLEGLADYSSTDNTLFQNLLKDPSVQQDVTLNDDGTYSFHATPGVANNGHQQLAMQLIAQQNGYENTDPGAQTPYSVHELEMFRQLTGYDLIQAGGVYGVVDDNGDPPAAGDLDMVTAAWNMFDLAKGGEDLEGKQGDLTADDLKDAAQGLASGKNANAKLFDDLIKMIETKLPDGTTDSSDEAGDPDDPATAAAN